MLRRILVLLALVAQVAPAQSPGRAPASDSALVARLAHSEVQFFRQWRDAWMKSVSEDTLRTANWQRGLDETFQVRNPRTDERSPYYKRIARGWAKICTVEMGKFANEILKFGGGERRISATATTAGLCPAWSRDDSLANAGIAADSLSRAAMRGDVLKTRNSLLRALDSAAGLAPGNSWITGQRVRFDVDMGDMDAALSMARTCSTNRWWCSALAGYVFAAQGAIVAADSAFAEATAATGGAARCVWTDAGPLLDPKAREVLAKLPCSQRDSLSERLLWLADPLFSVPGNERRVEHFVRRMSLTLRSGAEIDELYNWTLAAGGDATAEMVMRYGWPTRVYWMGITDDEDMDHELRANGHAPASPHLVPEYSTGRIHLVPTWEAIRQPLAAPRTSWSIASDSAKWWPIEHFMPTTSLAEICDDQLGLFRREPGQPMQDLPTDQSVALRRDGGVLLAYATDLSRANFGQSPPDTVVAFLIRTPGPDSIQTIAKRRVGAAATVVVRAPIPSAPAIIAFEVPNTGTGRPALRTRFGLTPPPSLADMAAGEKAISDPVILSVPPDGSALSNDPASALNLMLGSTQLAAGTHNIGVYWETYGFARADSVQIVVRVQRYTSQGVVGSLATALGLTSDQNAPVIVSWKEPASGHSAYVVRGSVPTVGRSLVLNVGGLPKGAYWLDISVGQAGAKAIGSRRAFVVE